MRILIDVDNTIENLLVAWTGTLDERYSTGVTPEDLTDWDLLKCFPGLTHEQIFGVLKDDGFWKKVGPIKGAPENIKKLIDDGHEIYLCTATDRFDIRPKFEDVIMRYFPFISWKQIIVCENKQMIKADMLIDDGIHNLIGGDYIKILFHQPHNASFDAEENGMIRLKTWDEIYDYISELTKTGD